MTETIEQPTITPEMIAAYQRQQDALEEQRRRDLLIELVELARTRGYEIVAAPQINDGRLIAAWGVRLLG